MIFIIWYEVKFDELLDTWNWKWNWKSFLLEKVWNIDPRDGNCFCCRLLHERHVVWLNVPGRRRAFLIFTFTWNPPSTWLVLRRRYTSNPPLFSYSLHILFAIQITTDWRQKEENLVPTGYNLSIDRKPWKSRHFYRV